MLSMEKLGAAEATKAIDQLRSMPWPEHDLNLLLDAVGRCTSVAAPTMASPSAKLQNFEAIDNFFRRGMGTITGSSLGMEAMAEFQTLTNTYGAQFGGNGAVMNAVSTTNHIEMPSTPSAFTSPSTRRVDTPSR